MPETGRAPRNALRAFLQFARNDSVKENLGCGAVQRPYQLFTVQQLPARFHGIRH